MRRWIALVVALVVGAGIALFVTQQPHLHDDRAAVDRAWRPLEKPLTARYATIPALLGAVGAAGGDTLEAHRALADQLREWNRLIAQSPVDGGPGAAAANDLEVLVARLRRNVAASDRFKADPAIAAAFAAYDTARVPEPAVSTYNRAVRSYEDRRQGTLGRPVALALGFDQRPALIVP